MKIYDVSVEIHPKMHIYPGDPGVIVETAFSMDDGDAYNVVRYCLGSHTGTHVDAPYHFVNGGRKLAEIPLNLLIGRTLVAELTSAKVDVDDLRAINLGEYLRVLFKTRNSYLWSKDQFVKDYVYVTPAAAKLLVDSGIKLVGIDYLSIEKFGSTDFAVHKVLLENGIVIIEGLNLCEVPPGDYEMICLPLKVCGGDGAPARVILRR
ncbi:MAG: cyclase family protein [Acidobacteriota bacterium]|nr:cyclase family protein [Blastocatellia bacterium]MDW8411066.1 cyclase family protein [Acidobacteriota bacterium]